MNMAAKYYIVEMADHTLAKDHTNAMVVIAENAADAKLMAQASVDGDSNGAWASATATEIASLIATDFEDWTLTVVVSDCVTDPADPEVLFEVSVVGAHGDSLDDMGDAMAAALVLEGLTASYATPALTVAAIADGIGDSDLQVILTSPDGQVAMTGFVGAIVDEGIKGAVLTVALVPARTISTVAGVYEKH
jgi:hypothetical protein